MWGTRRSDRNKNANTAMGKSRKPAHKAKSVSLVPTAVRAPRRGDATRPPLERGCPRIYGRPFGRGRVGACARGVDIREGALAAWRKACPGGGTVAQSGKPCGRGPREAIWLAGARKRKRRPQRAVAPARRKTRSDATPTLRPPLKLYPTHKSQPTIITHTVTLTTSDVRGTRVTTREPS